MTNKWTNQELRVWAENIAVTGYGTVTQKLVREVIWERANTEEQETGFTRDDIRTITEFVNGIQTSK